MCRYGFVVYMDPGVTDVACAGLNGMRMGERTLTVRRATEVNTRTVRFCCLCWRNGCMFRSRMALTAVCASEWTTLQQRSLLADGASADPMYLLSQ